MVVRVIRMRIGMVRWRRIVRRRSGRRCCFALCRPNILFAGRPFLFVAHLSRSSLPFWRYRFGLRLLLFLSIHTLLFCPFILQGRSPLRSFSLRGKIRHGDVAC